MNIEPIANKAMEFLKTNTHMPSLGTITNIGEISEVEWHEDKGEGGSVFVTNENPRVIGFKRA